MALSRSPVSPNLTTKTATFPVFSLLPIGGDFSGGDCTIILSNAALTISSSSSSSSSSPDNRTIATWRYSTIRDFSCTSALFCFTSGRRGPFGVHKYVFKVSPSVMPSLLTNLSSITGVDIAPLDTSTRDDESESWYSLLGVPHPPSSLGNTEDTNSHHHCANANFYTDVVSISASTGGNSTTSSLFQVSPLHTSHLPPSSFQVSPPPPPSTLMNDQSGATDAIQVAPPRRFWVRVPHTYEEIPDPLVTSSTETTNAVENLQSVLSPLANESPSPQSDSPTCQEGAESPVPFPLPPTPPPSALIADHQPSLPISPKGGRRAARSVGVSQGYEEEARPFKSPEPLRAALPQQATTSSILSSSGHDHRGQQVDPPSGRLQHKQQQQQTKQQPRGELLQSSNYLPDLAFLTGRYEMLPVVFGGGAVTYDHTDCASRQCDGVGLGTPPPSSPSQAATAQAINSGTHPHGDSSREQPITLLLKASDVTVGRNPLAPVTTQATPRGDVSFSGGNEEEGYEVLTPRSNHRFLLWESSPQPLVLQRNGYVNWTPPAACNGGPNPADDRDGREYIVMRESKPSKLNAERDGRARGGGEEGLPKTMVEGDVALGIVHHVIRPTSNDDYSNVCLRVQVVTGGDR